MQLVILRSVFRVVAICEERNHVLPHGEGKVHEPGACLRILERIVVLSILNELTELLFQLCIAVMCDCNIVVAETMFLLVVVDVIFLLGVVDSVFLIRLIGRAVSLLLTIRPWRWRVLELRVFAAERCISKQRDKLTVSVHSCPVVR